MTKKIIALLLFVSTITLAQEKILLRLNYEKGDSYTMTMKMAQEMGMGEMTNNMDIQMEYDVTGVSDDTYVPIAGAKMLAPSDKEMIWLVVKGHFAFPEDGSKKEFDALSKEYLDNVINKNEYIKGYYQHGHAWGADRTEYVRAFVIESMGDLDKMGKRSTEFFKEYWSDEAKRKEFGKKMGKYFTGKHGDYIYTSVPELTK